VCICRSYIVCICGAHMYVGHILLVCLCNAYECVCGSHITRVCMYVPYPRGSKECVYVGLMYKCVCGSHISVYVGHILQVCLWSAYECVCVSHIEEWVQSVYVGRILQECACMSHIQEYQESVYIYVGFISSTHPYARVSFIHNIVHCNTLQHTATHPYMWVSFHQHIHIGGSH